MSKKWFLRSLLFYTTFSWCLKVDEETWNICEVHTKILVCITCGLNVLKNPPEAAKVATLVNFFNVEKTYACFPHQDFEIQFFQLCLTHMSTAVCPSVRYTSSYQKKKKYLVQKSWWWKRQYIFLSEGLAVWRLSRNQFKPVWAETVKNYPPWKLEFLSPKNR